WLRYDVPACWTRREWRKNYKGQKQIWFLLRLLGRDSDVSLRNCPHPEFDAWRWNQYWVELGSVVEFKRQVYRQALTELSRLLDHEAGLGSAAGYREDARPAQIYQTGTAKTRK